MAAQRQVRGGALSESGSTFPSSVPPFPQLSHLHLQVLPVPPRQLLPGLVCPTQRGPGRQVGTKRQPRGATALLGTEGGAPPPLALRPSLPARGAGPAGRGMRAGSVRAAGRGSRCRLTRALPRSRAGECPRAGPCTLVEGSGQRYPRKGGITGSGGPWERDPPQEMGIPRDGVTTGSGGPQKSIEGT